MMKRLLALLLVSVTLLLALPLAARADVLIEPNSDFYTRHRDECTYLYRNYYANSKDGYVSVKTEPGAQKEVTAIENGETIFIMFTYEYRGKPGVSRSFSIPTKNGTSSSPAGYP